MLRSFRSFWIYYNEFYDERRRERISKNVFDALEEMSSESVEYVRGIPVVKTFGQSIFSFKRFYKQHYEI